MGAGLAVSAAAAAACTEDGGDAQLDDSQNGGRASQGDLDLLGHAAGLEALAVETYRDALAAAAGGKLGQVPAAGTEFMQAAHDQHQQGLDAINAVLEANDRDPVAESNTAAREALTAPGLTEATGFVEVARLVRSLEAATSATYLKAAQSQLQSRDLIRTAAGIQATGQKRVAILNFMLGELPSPDPFQTTDSAVAP